MKRPLGARTSRRLPCILAIFLVIFAAIDVALYGLVRGTDLDEQVRLASLSEAVDEWSELDDDEEPAAPLEQECHDSSLPPRNFTQRPVVVGGAGRSETLQQCSVPCRYEPSRDHADTVMHVDVLQSMESAVYYPSLELDRAHAAGYSTVMTTRLDSDVPVGYFSWAEYALLAPITRHPVRAPADAVAVISNCAANSFRMEAIRRLELAGVTVDKFGGCFARRFDGDKVALLGRYKFALAFENSIERDYVTEKYFQALVAGSVPVVIGASNIDNFSPGPNSILHIRTADEAAGVAERMLQLLHNATAYDEMLAWKRHGPSRQFLALVDMAVVHSACRLCLRLATQVRQAELSRDGGDCQCRRAGSGKIIIVQLLVRERGRMDFERVQVSIDTGDPSKIMSTLHATILMHYRSLSVPYTPIWVGHRPDIYGTASQLELYRIYAVGSTQDTALYGSSWPDDASLSNFLLDPAAPCPMLEVIFV